MTTYPKFIPAQKNSRLLSKVENPNSTLGKLKQEQLALAAISYKKKSISNPAMKGGAPPRLTTTLHSIPSSSKELPKFSVKNQSKNQLQPPINIYND